MNQPVNNLVILLLIHVVASLMLSARGPLTGSVLAYVMSLVINLCGFWPIWMWVVVMRDVRGE